MTPEVNYLFKDCIDEILECAITAQKEYPAGDYKDGVMLAYATALSSIKHKLMILDPDDEDGTMKAYCLDFDIDKKFLFSD